MTVTITVQAGDDETVLFPADGVTGSTVRAVARAYPAGPALKTWSTTDGTAVADLDGVHLVTDGALAWTWRVADLDVTVTAPSGGVTVLGPYRMRVRPLYSRA